MERKILQIVSAPAGWFLVWDDTKADKPDLVFEPLAFWVLYEDKDGQVVEGVGNRGFEGSVFFDPGVERVGFVGYMAPGEGREVWFARATEAREEKTRSARAPVPQPIPKG